jgi:nitrogen fixation protein NifX
LQLVWSIKQEPTEMLTVAFASNDRERVNQHFGAAEGFATYQVSATGSVLIGVAEFPEEAMDGNENKLNAKVEFLAGCAAVFVMAIGASAIKLLLAKGVQPIRIADNDSIPELLEEISEAIRNGGVQWVDRALIKAQSDKSNRRFSEMEEEGWQG